QRSTNIERPGPGGRRASSLSCEQAAESPPATNDEASTNPNAQNRSFKALSPRRGTPARRALRHQIHGVSENHSTVPDFFASNHTPARPQRGEGNRKSSASYVRRQMPVP